MSSRDVWSSGLCSRRKRAGTWSDISTGTGEMSSRDTVNEAVELLTPPTYPADDPYYVSLARGIDPVIL